MANEDGKKERKNGAGGIINVAGSSNLYMIYRFDGKQYKVSTGTSNRKDAEKMLKDKLAELRTNERRGVRSVEDFRQLRYEDIRDLYVKHYRTKGGKFIRRADGTEYVRGTPQIEKFFTNKRVSDITTETIHRYIESRQEDGISGPAIRRELVTLRAMFHQARKEKKISFDMIPHFPLPKDSEPAGEYIEPEDFAKILNHLPEQLRPFFSFMYATGCRLGALQSITWDMVSKDCKEIKLPGTRTKNGEMLTLFLEGPMLQPITSTLKTMFHTTDNVVFCSTNYRREWAKAVSKAGLGTWDKDRQTRTGVRIHDCRCSAAINLIDSGVDADLTLKIGGWKTMKMLSRYNVMNSDRVRKAMEKAGQYVAARMNGNA